MAYTIEGTRHRVVYCANYRVGSTATAATLTAMGAERLYHHHALPEPTDINRNTLVVQTVRHHCDVIVSYWYKKARGHEFPDFVNLVLDGQHPTLRADAFFDRYPMANYILRYENLQFEFDTLCLNAGLPETEIHRSPSHRPPELKWQDMFTQEMKRKMRDRYGEEMERLGYGCN